MIDTASSTQDDSLVALKRFELIARATHDVLWDWDLIAQTVWWNEGMEHVFGFKVNEVEPGPESWSNRIHPDDHDRVLAKINQVIDSADEITWSDYYRFRKADGSYAFVHDRGYTIKVGGKAVRMVGSMMDVTQQVQSEAARKESEENLRFAMDAAGLGSWNMNPATGVFEFNARGKELFGNPKDEELNYANLLQRVHFQDRERIRKAVQQAIDPEVRAPYDVRYRTVGATDKVVRWLHCKGQASFDKSGKAVRFAGVSREITDEIINEQKVLWADQQAAMTIEGSGAGSFLLKLSTNEIIYSPTMARILTGTEEAHITRSIFVDHLHPEDSDTRNKAYTEAAETGSLRYEARFIWNDKSIHWVRVIGQYLYDSVGTPVSLSGIVMDITDRIEAEQRVKTSEEQYRQLAAELELRVQQRTAELNETNAELINSNNNLQQFAYAASHDMQEPLRKIQSFGSRLATLYAEKLDDNGAFMLNRIQDASKRMSVMIDDLLAYSRLTTREAEFETVNMNELVSGVLADLEISIQEQQTNITVDSLPAVWGNAPQLTQLIQNLVSNAIKYRKPDQPSEIHISAETLSDADVNFIPKPLAGHHYVCLKIADNGIGFDEAHLGRIFQMFQRLHGRSEFSGSGIGLALCKKVVQNHHGYITAKSKPGEGATFLAYLPQPL